MREYNLLPYAAPMKKLPLPVLKRLHGPHPLDILDLHSGWGETKSPGNRFKDDDLALFYPQIWMFVKKFVKIMTFEENFRWTSASSARLFFSWAHASPKVLRTDEKDRRRK